MNEQVVEVFDDFLGINNIPMDEEIQEFYGYSDGIVVIPLLKVQPEQLKYGIMNSQVTQDVLGLLIEERLALKVLNSVIEFIELVVDLQGLLLPCCLLQLLLKP